MSEKTRFRIGIGSFFVFSLGLAIGLTWHRYGENLFFQKQPAMLPSSGFFYTGGFLPGGQWSLPMTVGEALAARGQKALPPAEMELVLLRESPVGPSVEINLDLTSQDAMELPLSPGDTLILRNMASNGIANE